MHIFHSRENLIFSLERNRKIGYFFLFSQYGLREATLYCTSVSFLMETTISVSYFYGNVNKKSESLRSLIKERAFINSSATTRKSKQKLGAQWLSGRVLDSRLKGRGFEPHRCHCVVSLSKNINPSLVLVQPRKTRPFITERLLMGRKESNQTNKNKS